jgi:hypothetical protein
LLKKVLSVILIHLPIEAKQVACKVRHSGALSLEIDSDLRPHEASTEVRFGKLVTLFEAGEDRFHAASIRLKPAFQKALPTGSQKIPLSRPAAM